MAPLLKRVDQQITALERRARFLMTAERKRDTREKILFGENVAKAGLAGGYYSVGDIRNRRQRDTPRFQSNRLRRLE